MIQESQGTTSFIPIDFNKMARWGQESYCDDRLRWLRQCRRQSTNPRYHNHRGRTIRAKYTLQTKFYDDRLVRYCAAGSNYEYVSDYGLSSKARRYIEEIQQQSKKSNVEDQWSILFQNIKSSLKNCHRYYNLCNIHCSYCRKKGHYLRDCHKRNGTRMYTAAQECYNCGKRGHIAKFCTKNCDYSIDMTQSSCSESPRIKGLFLDIHTRSQSDDIDY